MKGRLLVDLDQDGIVAVSMLAGDGELPMVSGRVALTWPLDGDVLEDLRWYLEDYLVAPFGVYDDRGSRVGSSLSGWGEAVFGAVFAPGPARDAYKTVRARGDVEVVFRSASPLLLALPWELMAEPGRDAPLALEAAGVGRSLLIPPDAPQTVPVAGGLLRVLMVISRPSGTGDVGYRMIARPLLKRLEVVRGAVELVVLRPPTLDALRAELRRAADDGMPYQVVHFDGHGAAFGRRPGAGRGLTFDAGSGEGVLVFEKPDAGADHVTASRVAQVLAGAKVPVVVLNACQSGAMGTEVGATVATRLLREGVASVVAMAYSVYAVAAAEFMAAFYETLFAGDTVTAAVTAGRQQMWLNPGRPSPKGDLPLEDWLVPVHYMRRDVSFPQAAVSRSAGLPSLTDALAALAAPGGPGQGDLDAAGGVFIGRDGLFYELEAAARLQKVIVLTGAGGTGKTELAKAFARWWRDSGGVERPEWVFWRTLDPGVAASYLDSVTSQIGVGLYGTEFELLEVGQRRAMVLDALAKHRILLVWDNFESMRSMPGQGSAAPPLDEAGCDELREFLAVVTAGQSLVLITSRTDEGWLGEVRRVRVGGLAAHEAAEYADTLLAPFPSARRQRELRAFGELMRWLDGHPLSMRLVLPRLDREHPAALLAALRGATPLPGDDAVTGQTGSLAASVAYSFAHLTSAARRLLPAISLLHGVADADVLAAFSQSPQVPGRFARAGRDDWVCALDDAARLGLLTGLGGGMYQIHPALPSYLAAAWQAEEPQYVAARAAAKSALLEAHAALGRWLRSQIETGDAGLAYTVIGFEHSTLGSLLELALDHELWESAVAILQPLDDYWDARGLNAEADAWADRVRATIEALADAPPQLDSPAGELWLYAARSQARRELRLHHFDRAEEAYRQVLSALLAMDTSPEQYGHLAAIYHQLGRVAEDRGDLGAAGDWYRESLAIKEQLGDRPGMAKTHHQLGIVAQVRGDLGAAADWYHQALAVDEELGDRPGMAKTHHELGIVAQEQGDLGAAADWYHQALAINAKLGKRLDVAMTYHQLGMVAQERGDLGTAADWYHQALAISEERGNRPDMAVTCHQLGTVAQERGDLSAAGDWYRKSLAISEELGNRPHMAVTSDHLGILAQAGGDLGAAEDWYRKSLAVKEEHGNRPGMATSYRRLGIVAQLAGDLATAEDRYRRALTIDEEFGDRPGMAGTYYLVGVVAQHRGDLDAAENWYQIALAINEELGDRPGMAVICAQSGLAAAERGHLAQAMTWAVRCVSLFDEILHPSTGTGLQHLARLTGQLGVAALEHTWREVTAEELPKTVRDYVAGCIREEGDTL